MVETGKYETVYVNNMLTSLPPFVLDLLLEGVHAVRYNRTLEAEAIETTGGQESSLSVRYRERAEMHVHRTGGLAAVAAFLAQEAGWDVSAATLLGDAYEAYDAGWRKKTGV